MSQRVLNRHQNMVNQLIKMIRKGHGLFAFSREIGKEGSSPSHLGTLNTECGSSDRSARNTLAAELAFKDPELDAIEMAQLEQIGFQVEQLVALFADCLQCHLVLLLQCRQFPGWRLGITCLRSQTIAFTFQQLYPL